jgi:hypothetical protein
MSERYRSADAAAIMTEMPPSVPELVHPIPVEEVSGWARTMTAAFLGDPDGQPTARRIDLLTRGWDPARAWGVRDGGRWVATLRTEERSLTVPGGGVGTAEVPVDAVTSVTVSAAHRRRGLMSRMLHASLSAARERTPGALGLVDLMFSTPLAPWTATWF